MADNYIEKRMEELRRGETGRNYKSASAKNSVRKGGFHFPFTPKRILIASGHPQTYQIARTFLKTESKVAIMQPVSYPMEGAIRFYAFDDAAKLPECFADLMKAWRDIDILIADAPFAAPLLTLWSSHRQRLPYVSDYTCRIIILGNQDPTIHSAGAHAVRATVNTINPSHSATDLSPLIAMLTLPANNIINGMKFDV